MGISRGSMLPYCYTFYMPDTSSHDATRRDDVHTINLSQLEAAIMAAGIVMSRRQITRHCKSGTFDAIKVPAANNIEHWFIAPASVEKGIADIKALRALRDGHDETRPDVTKQETPPAAPKIEPDTTGHVATRHDVSKEESADASGAAHFDTSRYVGLLERDNEFLREQVQKKDEQISDLSNRFSETQTLLGAMQRMLAPLLGQADPFKSTQGREVNKNVDNSTL